MPVNLNNTPTATVASGASLSGVVDLTNLWTGTITTPATLNATTVIGFTQCATADGTFTVLLDEFNSLVYVTVALDAAKSYNLPRAVMDCNYVKVFTMTTAGVAVNQTGDKVFSFSLKG